MKCHALLLHVCSVTMDADNDLILNNWISADADIEPKSDHNQGHRQPDNLSFPPGTVFMLAVFGLCIFTGKRHFQFTQKLWQRVARSIQLNVCDNNQRNISRYFNSHPHFLPSGRVSVVTFHGCCQSKSVA